MIKMIVSDIDGTLQGFRTGLHEDVKTAISEALDQGIRFAIASGRSYQDILPFTKEHGLSCEIIAGNGAEYYDKDGKLLATCYLNKELFRRVKDICHERHILYMAYTSKRLLTEYDAHEVQWGFAGHGAHQSKEAQEEVFKKVMKFAPVRHLVHEDDILNSLDADEEIVKLEGFSSDKEEMKALKDVLADIPGIAYLSSFVTNVEVTNEEATKGKIVMKVIKSLGIEPDEVLVLGDGMNDISMFELFKNSAAPENAQEEIKNLASLVVPDVSLGGAAVAIRHFIKDN